MTLLSRLLGAALAVLLSSPAVAVTPGQKDTFADGTTQGWFAGLLGSAPPQPPKNVAGGGPAGAEDAYLQVTATGGFGAGSRFSVINTTQWRGDYPAAGVTGIGMAVNNLGATPLQLRVLVSDSLPGQGATHQAVSTLPVSVPPGSGWIGVVFPLSAADLTAIQGTVGGALADVNEIRVFHAPTAVFPGPSIVAILGLDDIAALPDADADGDGVVDAQDDCTLVPNATQLDADHDGYGNACDADFDGNGVVNFADLARLKSGFFGSDAVIDLDGSGVVNFADLAVLKRRFFQPPGPSGLTCAGQVPCPPGPR